MKRTPWTLLLLLLLALPPAPALAAEPEPLPRIFDPVYRHYKRGEVEISLAGGSYLGASMGSSWSAGGRVLVHTGRLLAFGAAYAVTRTYEDGPERFGRELDERWLHVVAAEVDLSTDVAMLFAGTLLEMDLIFTLGVGAARFDSEWGMAGVLGGGVKFYTGLKWLAVRIDVDTYLHESPRSEDDSVEGDLAVTLGLSFLL